MGLQAINHMTFSVILHDYSCHLPINEGLKKCGNILGQM